MSGVNRNIIGNSAIPVGGANSYYPPDLQLQTVSGSRWILFTLTNLVQSGSGGNCQNVVLEWSTDPSMITNPFVSSSNYYAVTSSILSCNSASLSPLTGSIAYSQKIDSWYERDTGFPADQPQSRYYMRVYENRTGFNERFYSVARSVETRAINYCGYQTENPSDPGVWLQADMDGWQSPEYPTTWQSNWFNKGSSSGLGQWTASFSTAPVNIKAGGPDYDALLFQSASTITWNGAVISSGSALNYGFGIVTGSVTSSIVVTPPSGPTKTFDIFIESVNNAPTSSLRLVERGVGQRTLTYETAQFNTDFRNQIFRIKTTNEGIYFFKGIPGFENVPIASYTIAMNSSRVEGTFSQTVGAGTILRMVYGSKEYPSTIFSCKYGGIGNASYVG